MDRRAIVLAVASCGRIGFDPTGTRTPDGSLSADTMIEDGAQPAIPPGAGIWLEMETDPNVAVLDSAGGHAAACAATCPTRVAGVHGFGYHFTSNEITVSYSADLDPSSRYSAAVWFNLDELPTGAGQFAIWSKQRDPSNEDTFTFYVDSSGSIHYDCDDASGNGYSFFTGPMPAGAWHHVAVTWDGTTKLGYLDGALVGTVAASCYSVAATFDLGADYAPPGLFLAGTVDDAVFYTRVLTPAEIQQLATP